METEKRPFPAAIWAAGVDVSGIGSEGIVGASDIMMLREIGRGG